MDETTIYLNTSIDHYTLLPSAGRDFHLEEDFTLIDGYKDSVCGYIYSNVFLTDHTEPIEKAFQSRLQVVMSSTLLRSLMLKEGAVVSLNGNNFPAYYASLKSLMETAAVLGYIAELIYRSNNLQEIIPFINALFLGNREAGPFSAGSVPAINVLTMFSKLDRVIAGIATEGHTPEKIAEMTSNEKIMTDLYADICNFGHPNMNANLSIGTLGRDNIWRAKRNTDGYKRELYGFYMPGFTIALSTNQILCGLIARNPKVNNFNLLSNELCFG